MFIKTTEKGQALILIALAAIGLFAFAALAIDGSRVYSEKRHAQNAADTAALAGALAYTRADEDDVENNNEILAVIKGAVEPRATSNGFDGGAHNDVTISFVAATGCPSGEGRDITVTIVTFVDTTFARVIGRDQVTTAVTATAHACRPDDGIPYDGNAIVGLRRYKPGDHEKDCGITSGTSDWYVTGGGVWSNGCANAKKAFDLDDPPNEKCVTTLEPANPDDFPCTETAAEPYDTTELDKIMPDDPCEGTVDPITNRYASGGKKADPGQLNFQNDVFCLADIDYFDGEVVKLDHATLYVTDQNFDIKFPGNTGGFSGTATQAGTYAGSEEYDGYYMVIEPNTANPCTDFNNGSQTIVLRGNAGEDLTGMILAPTSCLDLRGTSDSEMHTQIIGYMVSGNGDATLTVHYDPDDNPYCPEDGNISVWE